MLLSYSRRRRSYNRHSKAISGAKEFEDLYTVFFRTFTPYFRYPKLKSTAFRLKVFQAGDEAVTGGAEETSGGEEVDYWYKYMEERMCGLIPNITRLSKQPNSNNICNELI
ncbi:hypothetical protein ACS0TY_033431 [Phlomoides rotata]